MWFIAHSAKIHNLFVVAKLFLEHRDDLILALDVFFKQPYDFFKILDASLKVEDLALILFPDLFDILYAHLYRLVAEDEFFCRCVEYVGNLSDIIVEDGGLALFQVSVGGD